MEPSMDCRERSSQAQPGQIVPLPRVGTGGRRGDGKKRRYKGEQGWFQDDTHMPGAPREVSPQDEVGNSTVFLLLPGEHRVHAASNVCVRAQEGIKEQGHRALASAFKAFRKVLQVLKMGHRSVGPPEDSRAPL